MAAILKSLSLALLTDPCSQASTSLASKANLHVGVLEPKANEMTSVRRLDVTCGDTELSTISKGDVRFDYVPCTIGREVGIVAFDKFFRISLHCKLVPVQTGEYVMFYLSLGCSLVKLCVMFVKIRFYYRETQREWASPAFKFNSGTFDYPM